MEAQLKKAGAIEKARESGMNPHWVDGKPVGKKYRHFDSVFREYHMQLKEWVEFDEDIGGLVSCKWCKKFPSQAKASDKITKGWYGERSGGYKWEGFKEHMASEKHQYCGKLYKGEVEVLNFEKNKGKIIEDGDSISRIQRLVQSQHFMLKHDIPDAVFEDLFVAFNLLTYY